MYNEVIFLMSEIESVDSYGDITTSKTERMVFAKISSIGTNEFYNAQATGLNPEIKFTIADYLDYQGELKLKYQPFKGENKEYKIIRTYRVNNALELTCQKVGD